MEDRHFGRAAASLLLRDLEGPVLVVGAGQGIIVEHYRRLGFVAHGLDRSRRMVVEARRRRGLDLVLADARALPFRDRSFATVILSSGVVDYGAAGDELSRMFAEAMRALAPGGRLAAAFYRLDPAIEEVYRRLGVIADGHYHPRRMFDIEDMVRANHPGLCAMQIARWSGQSVPRSFFHLARVGLSRPRALRAEEERMHDLLRQAAEAGVSRQALVGSMPEGIPYRTEAEVRALLSGVGLRDVEILSTADCTIACFRKEAERSVTAAAGSSTGEPHLRAERVHKRYRGAASDAVRGLSLAVARGEVFGLLGPNGAGKTTTLSMLAGLLAPDRGTIHFAGGLGPAAVRRRLGVVPQELALHPRLTARENLRYFGALYGVRGAELRRRTEELLDAVGLADRSDERVETWSGGMKRRLNLVAGLVHEPELVLLDEPTVGVDPQSRNRIFELCATLRRRGVTMLYTTHYVEEASRICDRVAIMDRGTVIVEGAPREIVARLGHTRIELHARALPDRVLDGLRRLPEARWVERQADSVTITARPDIDALDLIERARALGRREGAELLLGGISEPGLEGVFLDVTGRSLRDQPEDAA